MNYASLKSMYNAACKNTKNSPNNLAQLLHFNI